MLMKRVSGLLALGASVVLLAQACGSSDTKKKSPTRYTSGGEGGQGAPGDGGSQTGPTAGSGVGASSGAGADAGATTGGDASTMTGGQPSTTPGGQPSAGGDAGGAGGPNGNSCDPGFGDCDSDPSDCEQDLNLVTSCGACNKSCSTANATVACESQNCVVKSCTGNFADCVNGGDDGCESSLSSNEHCGSCERNCASLGSTCATNKCNEIPMQTGQPIGSDSSVNKTWAFSPDGLLHVGFNSYTVRRFPLDGSATQAIWSSGNRTAGWNSLLALGDTVYWSELGTAGNDLTSAVFSKKILDPSDTTPTLAWVPEWHVQFLRAQGNAFYWFSGDYQSGDPGAWIYTRPINAPLSDHGTRIMTVDQQTHNGVVAFNVTSDALYWITTQAGTGTAYELRTTPLAGGTPTVVPAAPGASTVAVTSYGATPTLQVAGATLYFNRDANDALDGIYSFKRGDAEPVWLVHGADIRTFVVDDAYFYYTSSAEAGVWKAPIAGGAGVQISDDSVSRIVGHDAKFVYTILSSCCAGSIAKVIK
jgi:hypothetical protein